MYSPKKRSLALWALALALSLTPSIAFPTEKVDQIFTQVYGSISTACTQDADADTGTPNALAMAAGKRWLVYCHDSTGNGVACECLQGISTVDAGAAAVGVILFAGEKMIVKQNTGNTHISCVPFVDNQLYTICPLD